MSADDTPTDRQVFEAYARGREGGTCFIPELARQSYDAELRRWVAAKHMQRTHADD